MNLKKILKILRKNLIVTIFFACILFVGLVVLSRAFLAKQNYIYLKVKVGSGFWWTASRPPMWYVSSIKEGEQEKDFLGRTTAQVLDKKYYPYFESNQYDIYLTVKVLVSFSQKSNLYSYKRSTIAVGSPVEFDFPSIIVTGAVIAMQPGPFKEKYVDRVVTITKRSAFPWEFMSLPIGDKYTDGKQTVLEVVDKKAIGTTNIAADNYGNMNSGIVDDKQYISVRVKARLKEENGNLFYGEEQLIAVGKLVNFITDNYNFRDFTVSGIE